MRNHKNAPGPGDLWAEPDYDEGDEAEVCEECGCYAALCECCPDCKKYPCVCPEEDLNPSSIATRGER